MAGSTSTTDTAAILIALSAVGWLHMRADAGVGSVVATFAAVLFALGLSTAGRFNAVVAGAREPDSVPKMIADLAPEASTLDLAGVRIALAGRTRDMVCAQILDARGEPDLSQVRSTTQALLKHQDAWVFTSLESTPRREAAQIISAAARLIDDATRRFPAAPDALRRDGDAPFRSGSHGDSVFVVSLVVTTSEHLRAHQDESHRQTKVLLEHLGLAEQVHSFVVVVSDLFSIDELIERDPAMQGIA